MQVSKHHYARALATLGHRVDFVEPPIREGGAGHLAVSVAEGEPNIRVVRYRPWFPYFIKFHAPALFDIGMRRQARIIAAATGPHEIVWDFDNNYQFNDLRAFDTPLRVMQLVDQVGAGRSGTRFADLVVALDRAFIERVGAESVENLVVPHGLNPWHAALANRVIDSPAGRSRLPNEPWRVGYVGNLMMTSVDRQAILETVVSHPAVMFDFVSPVGPDEAGFGPNAYWLRQLADCANVTIRTGCGPREIVALADRIDAWMLCYSLARDNNAGVNSHKMLEYLATGSPVLTSWLKPYEGSAMVVMASRGDNSAFPALLGQLLSEMEVHDVDGRRRARARFALKHGYEHHVATIAAAINALNHRRLAG